MKTVELNKRFDYQAHPRKTVRFEAGCVYIRVIEAAAKAIVAAGAGRIIDEHDAVETVDASNAWRPS
jgi:hypothetical protein